LSRTKRSWQRLAPRRFSGVRLWQKNKNRGPWDTITITEERKKRGFTSIGKVTINKETKSKKFEAATGFFIEKNNP
jgi:hypothetical protein|tara:strand:- start:922 stop:1149 length:228 start_codon:yes stop_codon:yes gene_type:complete